MELATRIGRYNGNKRRVHLGHEFQAHFAGCIQAQQHQADDQATHRYRTFNGKIG